jgi:hypothetical protein
MKPEKKSDFVLKNNIALIVEELIKLVGRMFGQIIIYSLIACCPIELMVDLEQRKGH